ncbi:MAG: tetratricopeptide repeat protein [Betaproteobacteria bacterium]|nr:MAG: tetratricopeptide repeat protein [Betaproteobacteria bacterium]TMH95804.1 MAG: tetratricopeptide repeat protein [Betaproteobacteria bacterium]
MATYDLEEQEQLAALKAWWNEHGGAIILGATLVLAAVGAWNAWTWYQRSQSAQAAVLYDTLQKAARANDLKTTRETAGAILENFPRSAYAPLAALVSAKVQFQAGDLKTARAQLQWVIEHARSDEIRSIATLRLASVLLDDNEPDAALKILEAKPHPGFEALYASQRGDILATQKKRSEARAAYKTALEKAGAGPLRDALRLKLDALGEG